MAIGQVERYENTEEGHSKFWQVEIRKVNGSPVATASWGRIGKPAQGTKDYPIESIDKLIREKMAKGYVKV